jgi:hypothetical protein
MSDSDSDSDEFDLPPMISLEDLVGPSNAEVVATTRVIFPRCDATPAELAAVESHLRRCLAYPVIAYAPAFEGRCELLLAILEELRRNDSNTGVDPAPPEPLGEEAPEENFAGRVALADLEASLSECRDQERFSRIGGSRSALAASLRWRRRAAALEALRKPLRERLGIKDLPPKAAPTRQLALKSASTAAAHTGGAQSFSVLRSLSFERKKKEAVVSSDGGSGRGASGGGEDGGGGKSFSILRSLSFERKKKEADVAGTSKQSKQKQAMLRAAAAKGGGAAGGSTVTKSKVLLAAWASTHGKFGAMTKVKLEITESQVLYERHEIDLAAVEGAWAHQAGYCTVSIKFTHKPKPKVFMLEQSDACEKVVSVLQDVCNLIDGEAAAAGAPEASPPPPVSSAPPFQCDLGRAGRVHQIVLFALVSAWQRRAFASDLTRGVARSLDAPPPFPVEEDGSFLLRGGISGWLLDELVARCAISQLWRALGVLSVAVEGAVAADANGRGAGAPPDILRLASDALAQVLLAVKAEDSSAHEAAHDLGGAGGAGAQSSGGARRKRFGTKADLALQSAAAASPSQLRGRLSTWEEGEGGARYGALGDGAGADEADEDSTVAVGRAELSCYSACLSALSGYVSARLPTLIAERDEMVAEAEEGGGGAEHGVAEGAKCAELLVHLLSLSHRLTPAEDTGRVSYRDMHDERGDEWQVKEGSEASGVGGGERFVWQSKVCPPSLAASSRSALRAAATLMTEQEMRAASQTRRPKALTASGATEKTKKGDRPKASQAADVRDEVWTHWVRLKRLRVRLQRALPLQLSLLSGVVGGPGALVQVWAEALHFAVLEPLHMLGESLPVDMALVEVLSMALEHRRIVMLLQATAAGGVAANAAAAFLDDDAEGGGEGGGEGGEARSPALSASPSSGMGDGVGDELMLIGDRMWYSPFVFEWLRVASRHIESWVNEALDDETNWRHWRPVGPGRHSRTLILLFRACFTMVNSLRRLDVVVCGEAVSAAQGIADHHATFAAVLAKAATAASASAPPPAASGKDRTVVANKAAGAEPLLGVQGVARGLLRGTDVLITYVQPTSVLATLIHPGERVLSVNGEAVTSAAQALRLLKTASQLRVKVQAPPGLEEVGSDGVSLEELRQRRREMLAERMRELLKLLRVETEPPVDDPLDAFAPMKDDDPMLGLLGGTDGAKPGAAEPGPGSPATRDVDDDEYEEDGNDEANEGDEGDEGEGGGPRPVSSRELRRHCLIASNAWAARRQLQTLASTIEETLHSSTEQSSIVSACFVEVFGALRRTSDEQISVLADKLLRPVRAHIAKLGAPATPSGTLLGTKAGGASEFNLVQARTLDRLCRWLAPEAVQRLLQRLWTDVLSDLLEALRKQLYTPRELGDSFVKGAIQLMRDFAAVLLDATDGPTKRWLTQRATPLQATLALTELPTAALLQQYRIRPTGPTRAAPLVALALRLDDREAASVVMEQPAELAEGQALNVDGRPALEAYRTLEPLV